MIEIILTKDIKSPWNERKTLARGTRMRVAKEIGRQWLEDKTAKPVVVDQLKEVRESNEDKIHK